MTMVFQTFYCVHLQNVPQSNSEGIGLNQVLNESWNKNIFNLYEDHFKNQTACCKVHGRFLQSNLQSQDVLPVGDLFSEYNCVESNEARANLLEFDRVAKKIFVGNLGPRMSTSSLCTFFSKFGCVINCFRPCDYRSACGYKSYAFVSFKTSVEADRAINAEAKELVFYNRELRVFPAEERKRPISPSVDDDLCMFNPSSVMDWDEQSIAYSEDDETDVSVNGNTIEDILKIYADSNFIRNPRSRKLVKEEAVSVDILNDYCLKMIFSMLPLPDQVQCERVCVRWRMLSLELWTVRSHLEFKHVFGFTQRVRLNNYLLKDILEKCNRNLKSLDLSTAITHTLGNTVGCIIGKACPVLTKLNLTGVPLTNKSMMTLTKSCGRLVEFTLKNSNHVGEKGFWWLFHCCQLLKVVDLTNCRRLTGKCFHHMGGNITVLRLGDCHKIQSSNFSILARNCPLLKELDITNCSLLTPTALNDICEETKELEVFDLSGYFPSLTASDLTVIYQLKKLKILNFSENLLVNNLVLEIVSNSCINLQVLNITGCNYVADEGFIYLSQLQQLKVLEASYLFKVTNEGLKKLAMLRDLEILILRGTIGIGDIGCVEVVTGCTKLMKLDLSGIYNIGPRTLDACVDALGCREVTDKIEVFIGGTSIMHLLHLKASQCPNLIIQEDNLCLAHRLPDGIDMDQYIHLENLDNFDADYEEDFEADFAAEQYEDEYFYYL